MAEPISLKQQLENMRRDWDLRAKENARHYVATDKAQWSDEEFFRSGEQSAEGDILNDTENIYQGKDPRQMRVLEIGCGAGRVTRALGRIFGEVHAVDVSGEMVAQARRALADMAHVHIYQNNGYDLSVVPPLEFDFAYSFIVFQHVPNREIIENYVREASRLLHPGALFKFQVQGFSMATSPEETWVGVSYSEAQAKEMAERCGFEARYTHGAGDQYFWLWFFKKPLA
jgi:ubiquinone/menaquinone biosynthesis C-methylase UbiE